MRGLVILLPIILSGCGVYDSVRRPVTLHLAYATPPATGSSVTWARFSERRQLPLVLGHESYEVVLPEVRVSGMTILVFPILQSKTDERLIFEKEGSRLEASVRTLLREEEKYGKVEIDLEAPNKKLHPSANAPDE